MFKMFSLQQSYNFMFQAALECAIDYAQKRFAFGQPIASFQGIQVITLKTQYNVDTCNCTFTWILINIIIINN